MNLSAGVGSGRKRAYVGDALSANPLSCAAGYLALLEMERPLASTWCKAQSAYTVSHAARSAAPADASAGRLMDSGGDR